MKACTCSAVPRGLAFVGASSTVAIDRNVISTA